MNKMNKKGAMFHWIIFGMLVAIGIFFVQTFDFDQELPVKGKWHLDFLRENYLNAEHEYAARDSAVRLAAREVANELIILNSLEGTAKPCGEYNGISLWDTPLEECLLEDGGEVAELLQTKLEAVFPPETIKEINVEGRQVVGNMKQLKTVGFNGVYEEKSGFTLSLGYFFE